jgi:Xaa-Pro aminopeptidase
VPPSNRLEHLQDVLASQGAGTLLVLATGSIDPDLQPFVGERHLGSSWLAVSAGAARLAYATAMEREEAAATGIGLLTPEDLDLAALGDRLGRDSAAFWGAWVARGIERAGVAPPGPLLLAGHPPAGVAVEVARALGQLGHTFSSGDAAVRAVRRRKTDAELNEIRRVTAAVGEAFTAVADLLAGAQIGARGELILEGEVLRVARLRSAIRAVFAAAALDQPKGNIVACGRDGGVPHNPGTDETEVRAGESVVVDLFPRGRLFSDATRTFVRGDVPAGLRRAHALTAEALKAAVAATRAGAVGWDLQRETCRRFAEEGFATLVGDPKTVTGYVHGLGHGVGLELHEDPSFRAGAGERGVLAERDVVTLEPGLYDPSPGGYGVRIEDLVIVEAEGCEVLTAWPTDLDPRAWDGMRKSGGGER